MARCPKCGKDSPDQARFCRSCGAALAGAGGGDAGPGSTPEQRAQRLLEEAFRLSEEGRVLAAIQACQQAIAINPNSVSAHSLLGTLYERQGERENAIREYEQVLTLSPESTVERRRLNELMGVPTAREGIAISPGTARLAVTGSFVVVAIVVLAALVFYTQQGPSRPRKGRPPRPGPSAAQAVPAGPAEIVPAPGSVLTLGRLPMPAPAAQPRGVRRETTAQPPRRDQFGQWVAPGTYILPSGGSMGPHAVRSPGRGLLATGPAFAPVRGALPYRGTPVVATPAWERSRRPGRVELRPSPRHARNYYFRGDYGRAIEAYQSYLAQYPSAGAAPREELAWVYAESGDTRNAVGEYRRALSQYQSDLARGHNVEAAKHGMRTCQSAIRALEGR